MPPQIQATRPSGLICKSYWVLCGVELPFRWRLLECQRHWMSTLSIEQSSIIAVVHRLTEFHRQCVFTVRSHAILSDRLSARLSVRCVYCDKTKWCTADILVPHETAITLVFRHQHWLVGGAPFPVKCSPTVTHTPSKNADFNRFPLITSQP